MLRGTFGPLPFDTWKPWKYSERIKVVRQVEQLKTSLAKSELSASTKRSKVTSCFAEQKSKQEFVPIIGELIDLAHVDAIHLKNNACALAFRRFYTTVLKERSPNVLSFLARTMSQGLI